MRVFYRLKREDSSEFDQVFEPMPGFNNLDASGDVINENNNSGLPDRNISPSLKNAFNEYEYTADDLPQFTSFQVKIVFNSSTQSEAPELLDFRTIAVA